MKRLNLLTATLYVSLISALMFVRPRSPKLHQAFASPHEASAL